MTKHIDIYLYKVIFYIQIDQDDHFVTNNTKHVTALFYSTPIENFMSACWRLKGSKYR